MARTLILGGSGFLGGNLVVRLRYGGHPVTVLSRGSSGTPVPDDVEHLIADRGDPVQVRGVLGGREWDVVFDLSGMVTAAGGTAFADLVAMLDGRVGRYVFVSSPLVYEPTGVFPWHEESPLRDEPITTYSGFKVYAERALLEWHRYKGFPVSIARPGALYGPGNKAYDMETAMFARLRQHRPVLLPHGGLVISSYGHVDDLCAGLLHLAADPAAVGEVFNLSGQGVTSRHYVDTLASVVGVEADVVALPDEVLPALRKPVFGHRFSARHHSFLATGKAAGLLSLPAGRDFRSGHEETYRWFLSSPLAEAGPVLATGPSGIGFDFGYEAEIAAAIRKGR